MDNENENKDLNENLNDEELDNIVTLKDEDGNDVKFEFLDLIEYNGDNYVILLPQEDTEDEESDEVVILKEDKEAKTDGDEESYVSVDDEDTLDKVFAIFKDKFKDEFNFTEE